MVKRLLDCGTSDWQKMTKKEISGHRRQRRAGAGQ